VSVDPATQDGRSDRELVEALREDPLARRYFLD
jgi:hypothetical protein